MFKRKNSVIPSKHLKLVIDRLEASLKKTKTTMDFTLIHKDVVTFGCGSIEVCDHNETRVGFCLGTDISLIAQFARALSEFPNCAFEYEPSYIGYPQSGPMYFGADAYRAYGCDILLEYFSSSEQAADFVRGRNMSIDSELGGADEQ
jgi:hypothetical protein